MGRRELGQSENERVQQKLREATELACQELDWHENRDDGNARWYLERVAEQCGVDSTTDAGDMANGIGDHIEFLAGQCQDKRVEPAECDCCDTDPETVEVRIGPMEYKYEPLNSYELQLKNRVDELAERVRKLEERSPSSPGYVFDCLYQLENDTRALEESVSFIDSRLRDYHVIRWDNALERIGKLERKTQELTVDGEFKRHQ